MGRVLSSPPNTAPPSCDASHADASSRGLECTICLDPPSNPIVTFCGHLYCYECLLQWVKLHSPPPHKQCPVCKTPISKVVKILGQQCEAFPHSPESRAEGPAETKGFSSDLDCATGSENPSLGTLITENASEESAVGPSHSLQTTDSGAETLDRGTRISLDIGARDSWLPGPFRSQSATAQTTSAVDSSPSRHISAHTPASVSNSPQANPTATRRMHFREGRLVKGLSRLLLRRRPQVHGVTPSH